MSACMTKPQAEHEWLLQLVGEWTYEAECLMGPDQPPMKSTGTQSFSSFGGLWLVGDGTGTLPDGSPATTRMTLGYDPQKERYVGSFIGSMMGNQWVYIGTRDAAGTVLTLDTEGPDFSKPGAIAAYQDIVEIKSADHHVLSSRTKDADGGWQQFMTAHYRRVK
ncbi:hypothetical protein B5U98_16420 [Bosea sp. Tri-39]|nr:hypothetical protein B5U98_16420 [Bosea sp. Tri-39]RXT33212.1 hypothetical protein B5U99_27265 [Bosea sp. Tri-54]